MFARITIQSGIAAGTSHLIKGRVARIGSDPRSNVCLPTSDIPAHALTLEFKNESCRVYNRCRENIYIGAQIVAPDNVASWEETDILQIGSDTELLLDFDAEAHQAYDDFDDEDVESDVTEAGSVNESSDNPATDPKQKSSSAKTVMQLMVTVGCIVGCLALLVRDQNRKQAPNTGPGFAEIVASSIDDAEVPPELIQRIQYAEAQRIRGRAEIAQDEFRSIRDDLIGSEVSHANAENKTYENILGFIKTRVN